MFGYRLLSCLLQDFYSIGALPPNLTRLVDKNYHSLEELLTRNEAKWHKKCYTKYNKTKLARARARSGGGHNTSKLAEDNVGKIINLCVPTYNFVDTFCISSY